MAVIKNISPDKRSLFNVDAPPVDAGDEATISDARFVNRAWPKETWELVEPPADCDDVSVDDAHIFVPAAPKKTAAEPATTPKKAGKQS